MQYTIVHEVPGRLRVSLTGVVREQDVDPLTKVLTDCPAVLSALVYPRIGSAVVVYGSSDADRARDRVLAYLDTIDQQQLEAARSEYTYALATRTHDLVLNIATLAGGFVLRRLFLPNTLNMLWALWQYRRFLVAARQSLANRRLEVPLLDAAAIGASFAQKDAQTGSRHFVVGEERVHVRPEQHRTIREQTKGLSVLYLAVDGTLVGAIGIDDPLKPNACDVVRDLHELGFEHVVMLTGDNKQAAERVASEAGIDEWCANMLPEDKHAYVERLRREGRRVVMVGDGVNDSPALRAANVGIAMAAGTAIAREVADVTLTDSNLESLVKLRKLSMGLMARLDATFRAIMLWNSGLLALGIGGVITPQTSSLLHNASTVALGAHAMRGYLPGDDR